MQAIKLNYKTILEITPTKPFSFETTFYKPSHFPTGDRIFKNGIYYQSLNFKGSFYGIKIHPKEDNKSVLVVTLYSAKKSVILVQEIRDLLIYRFELHADLKEFYSLYKTDPILSKPIKSLNGMRVSTPYSMYEFLVITTVLQNTVVKRSVQMMENLFKEFGTLISFDGLKLYSFWAPESIVSTSEIRLRELKLGYRAKIIKRQATEYNEINESLFNLEKDVLKKRLLKIYGIGPASVQYLLFEVFHHYDALDYLPPWEQKIYSMLLFSKESVESDNLLKVIEKRWNKYRMLAMHYIFENVFWERKLKGVSWLDKLIKM